MKGCRKILAWGAGAVVALVIALVIYLCSIDFFAADDCLDRGGSYHYDQNACSFTENYRGEVPPLWPF